MKPSIGRIVHYALSAYEAERASLRREVAGDVGNPVSEGDVFPALIVRVWGDSSQSMVNLQVFLDGSDNRWITSVSVGVGPGTYAWPTRV
jgi:hypothetical protein